MEGWLCDGEQDCHTAAVDDTADEDPALCAANAGGSVLLGGGCPAGHIPCRDLSQCLPVERHCDNRLDCRDNSDEGPFCQDVPVPVAIDGSQGDSGGSCRALNCSHQCRRTRAGPKCYCPAGRQPAGSLCVDANECALAGTCDQICTDLAGGYKCACLPGYELVPPATCRAVNVPPGEPATLLFANSGDIQHVHLNGSLIARRRSQETLTLDFNHRNRSVCWINHRRHDSVQRGGSQPQPESSTVLCAPVDRLADEAAAAWALPPPDMFSMAGVNQLAYDWAGDNWYFLDEGQEAIFVCRQRPGRDRLLCNLVAAVRNSRPRGIALDPSAGTVSLKLLWYPYRKFEKNLICVSFFVIQIGLAIIKNLQLFQRSVFVFKSGVKPVATFLRRSVIKYGI
jgi:integrin beta 2